MVVEARIRPAKASKKPRKPFHRKHTLKRSQGKQVSGKKRKEKTISQLQKITDTIFSLFVRLSGSDGNGIATCYTCGYRAHYKKLQAGHYVSRFYKLVRYDERNVRIQCAMCNIWKKGDPVTFRENLVKEYDEDVVLDIEACRRQPFKSTREFYQNKIDYYTEKVDNLLKMKSQVLE